MLQVGSFARVRFKSNLCFMLSLGLGWLPGLPSPKLLVGMMLGVHVLQANTLPRICLCHLSLSLPYQESARRNFGEMMRYSIDLHEAFSGIGTTGLALKQQHADLCFVCSLVLPLIRTWEMGFDRLMYWVPSRKQLPTIATPGNTWDSAVPQIPQMYHILTYGRLVRQSTVW